MWNQRAIPRGHSGSGAPDGISTGADKIVYWHRELPPLCAEPLGEHIVEADSPRVTGDIAHRGALWDRCYQELMTSVHERLCQEVHRLGGDYAHVLGETIDSRHDYRTGEVWLHSRLTYLLLRRPLVSGAEEVNR